MRSSKRGRVAGRDGLRNERRVFEEYVFREGAGIPRRALGHEASVVEPKGFRREWTEVFRGATFDNFMPIRYWVPQGIGLPTFRKGYPCEEPQALEPPIFEDLRRRVFEAQHALSERLRDAGAACEDFPAEGGEGVVRLLLNGSTPAPLYVSEDGSLAVVIEWDEDSFHERYWQPNVRAWLRLEPGAEWPSLEAVELGFPGAEVRRFERPEDESEPGWRAALLAVRSAYLLWGELDVHLARAHFLAEFYQVAILGAPGLEPGHPLRRLLAPHLQEADAVNQLGDLLITGPWGALPVVGALPAEALEARCLEAMGRIDWREFEPRLPVCRGHRFARAGRIYWEYVRGVAEQALAELSAEEVEETCAVLGERFAAYGPRWRAESRVTPEGLRMRSGDRTEYPPSERRDGSPRSEAEAALSAPQTRDDLVQLSAHVIYHTTFFHSWINDGQVALGGRHEYARLGLDREAGPIPAPAAPPEEHAEWSERVGSGRGLSDVGYQTLIAHILTETRVGSILDVAWGRDMPAEVREALGRLGSPVELMRGNVNA